MVIWNKKYIDIDTKCRLNFYARFFFCKSILYFSLLKVQKRIVKIIFTWSLPYWQKIPYSSIISITSRGNTCSVLIQDIRKIFKFLFSMNIGNI